MIRTVNAASLAQELVRVRQLSLALFEAYEAAGALDVPALEEFNLPLWELGHVGWFQQWWIGRNQQRHLGAACHPAHQRLACTVLQAAHHGDDWYNSSTVAHAARWKLPLLAADDCRHYLQSGLDQTLRALSLAGEGDDDLYFFRLVLLHEAMHIEAAVYMAQALGDLRGHCIKMPGGLMNATDLIANYSINTGAIACFSMKKQSYTLGSVSEGFAFDNELGAHAVHLPSYHIDARPVSWAQYLDFVQTTGHALPRYLRATAQGYERQQFGHWEPLPLHVSAVHIGWPDAQAYCLWAGRRLPTEAEWECAASTQEGMLWGDVWEWTASDFSAYPGFVAHPYRDYSEPWFGSRKVLRGACVATLPIMRHVKYRNYFTPDRTDIYAGFRTCAL